MTAGGDLGERLRPGFEGSGSKAGTAYHQHPFLTDLPFERGETVERVAQIDTAWPVATHRGLDIGCSVGGLSAALEFRGAAMTGVDYDGRAIEVARAGAPRALFHCSDLTPESMARVLAEQQYDFAIWLSSWQYVARQHGRHVALDLLGAVAAAVPVVFFEDPAGASPVPGDCFAGSLEGVSDELGEIWREVTDLGPEPSGWGPQPRHVFMCRTPRSLAIPGRKAVAVRDGRAVKFHDRPELCQREARLLRAAGNVTPIVRYSDDRVIVMDAHPTLANWLHQHPDDRKLIGERLRFQYKLLHERGICHRDVVPGNIVVEESTSRPLLVDFEWAELHDGTVACFDLDGAPSDDDGRWYRPDLDGIVGAPVGGNWWDTQFSGYFK